MLDGDGLALGVLDDPLDAVAAAELAAPVVARLLGSIESGSYQ